jgi:hypothetical protein
MDHSCPRAESLVPSTHWNKHTLAPGVRLYEGSTSDKGGRGRVKMHVLRVDLTRRQVSVRPLMRSVAARAPLTALTRGHKHLIVAVNTGYYDFVTGAPTQPLIIEGRPLVISARPQRVVGFDTDGKAQSGSVQLSATLTIDATSHKIAGINTIDSHGIVIFDASWGATPIPTAPSSVARSVVGRRLGNVAPQSAGVATPAEGYELVAHRRTAAWLAQQPPGTPVRVSSKVVSSAAEPFVQAYGVGTAIVVNGTGRTGLACSSAGTKQPARTAIGIADHGSTLVIGEVEDHPGTKLHGLDEDQMGKFMEQLGVDEAYDLDGSGSTELLARMPGTSKLTMRTYPADGKERPMPVGLGISYRAPRHSTGHNAI